ncbi:lipocalin family protein (plasmid) [Pseudoalteromonas xiamenensis]|uniref:lipocalin family protein n=1 Tax=Pseudoalteromonas xiamenensis TaxID=882626 RepID=UPI0027E3C994|nr:lipocalin family protein [Pseudoalteromonas xiamenensis]WMN62011.1 lipocalin family protein [Pseudoalteromonas xiamenensis]
MKNTIIVSSLTLLTACTSVPQGIEPISGFELDRYMGKWYEIARIENQFEAGLDNVTAEYSLKQDGSVKVINRGLDADNQQAKEAIGTAKFVGDPQTAHLKVSFFGPFYASYIVFELDKSDYQYAYVSGYNKDYLWLLSRTPSLSESQILRFKMRAERLGFDLSKLVFPAHTKL